MTQQQYPFRFGVVLDCDDHPPQEGHESDSSATSTDICRLFAAAREDYSAIAGISFLYNVASQITEGVQSLQVTPQKLTSFRCFRW